MSKLTALALSLLFISTIACGTADPQDDCNALAEVSCYKLEGCMGFEYESCVNDYKRDVCNNVEAVSEDYTKCYLDVASLTCDGVYPPTSCDDALIMKKNK